MLFKHIREKREAAFHSADVGHIHSGKVSVTRADCNGTLTDKLSQFSSNWIVRS